MSPRRSISLPITLAIIMIVLLVVLTVGWVILAVFGALADRGTAPLYWTLLSVGTTFLVLVLVGVIMYMVLTIKEINLNRRQSNFIDSVTHELKSPIASLKLYLQTLNRHQVSDEQRADFNRYMLEDVERLDALINHLLDAGRLDQGPVAAANEEFELATLIRQCGQTVCMRYRVPQETITYDLQGVAIYGRARELEMIFRNLLDNAVKYAGTPPEVKVSLHLAKGNQAVVHITDNGTGIPPQMRRRIFGRFVRLGKELEREKPGTGLGLYIVRTLVDRMRGHVRVSERHGNSGTTFEVRLPGAVPLSGAAEKASAQDGVKAAPPDSARQEVPIP